MASCYNFPEHSFFSLTNFPKTEMYSITMYTHVRSFFSSSFRVSLFFSISFFSFLLKKSLFIFLRNVKHNPAVLFSVASFTLYRFSSQFKFLKIDDHLVPVKSFQPVYVHKWDSIPLFLPVIEF